MEKNKNGAPKKPSYNVEYVHPSLEACVTNLTSVASCGVIRFRAFVRGLKFVQLEAFLRSVVLSVPARTWQESVRGAFALTAPVGKNNSPGQVRLRGYPVPL